MAVRTRKSHAVMSAPSGGGGGILSILGGLMGAGGMTGGGFNPGVSAADAEADVSGKMKSYGANLNDEDQSIDANNRARTESKVKATPASFTPASASNP